MWSGLGSCVAKGRQELSLSPFAHARETSMLEFAQGLLEISSILGQFVL